MNPKERSQHARHGRAALAQKEQDETETAAKMGERVSGSHWPESEPSLFDTGKKQETSTFNHQMADVAVGQNQWDPILG